MSPRYSKAQKNINDQLKEKFGKQKFSIKRMFLVYQEEMRFSEGVNEGNLIRELLKRVRSRLWVGKKDG